MKTLDDLTSNQRGACRFLAESIAGILWADVGCGKTVCMCTALLRLLNRFDCGKILVVGPRLVAERVWSAEVTEWAHLLGLRVVRITGTPAQRLKTFEQKADIYTITRDNVQWLEEQFIRVTGIDAKGKPIRAQYRQWLWDTLVLDESQSFKNQDTKRFDSMRRLRRFAKRVYLLTGSFMPNGYEDIWSQMYLIDGGKRLGLTESAYHMRWFEKSVSDGVVTYQLKDHAKEEIDRLISDVVYVLKDDRKEPVRLNPITVTLDKAEQKLYSQMARKACMEVAGKQITAVNAGVLWGKLLQLANGAVYDAEHEWHEVHRKKLEALGELLESLPRPVLIGYGFQHDIQRVVDFIKKEYPLERIGIIRTGRSLDAWRAGEFDIGIMHPASAGHGLNDMYVSGAENLIWFGLTPNREYFEQLNGRLAGGHRRAGRNVVIHTIITENTKDEEAMQLLEMKGSDAAQAQIRMAQRWIKEAA